ncbi:MAG: M20/M25/M40 family metallo-hydrolase, partial [Verrucomicrobiales bacterium]|nr:M20/M25/M40 family metallo-hydrolase [Verrucomicrobiales bacterium]
VTLPVGADSRFFRVLDLGPSVTEDNAYLATRMGDRFLEDLAALVRIPTYRDDAPDSERRVTENLRAVRSHLQSRIDRFNAGQRILKIVPFEWREEVQGVPRWVFGFRVGNGPRKFSMLTHLDTVPPGDASWRPFEPRIEKRIYRGSSQDFLVGRGSVDDKGPSVIALSVLEAAAKRYDQRPGLNDWTLEVTFDTSEETDINIPAYLDAVGSPELGIVFDAFWTVRAEKGVERPVFRIPLQAAADNRMQLVAFGTAPGAVNQISDHAFARIDGGSAASLDALAADIANRYRTFVFDDPTYHRAPLEVSRDGTAVILTTTVEGAQHGSAPVENRAGGANPLVSLGNFLSGLVKDGTLPENGYGRMCHFIAWGWGTRVLGENHPELLKRSDNVFQEGNGTTYALTRVTTSGLAAELAIDIRYAQGHQSVPWDGVTDGELQGTSTFPQVFSTLIQQFNAIHPEARMTFETSHHSSPDVRNPDGDGFRHIREAYQEVIGKPCPLFAIGGGSDAHGYPNLIAAGALFSADFDPPINYHGSNEGAPIEDFRLSARILWQLLLRQVGDAAGAGN